MATHSSILTWRKSHRQRSLAGYSPQSHKESNTIEMTLHAGAQNPPWLQMLSSAMAAGPQPLGGRDGWPLALSHTHTHPLALSHTHARPPRCSGELQGPRPTPSIHMPAPSLPPSKSHRISLLAHPNHRGK